MAEEIIDPNKGLIDMPDLAGSEVCKNLYESFYASIKSSQGDALEGLPEQDQIVINNKIKNAAYNLASPIANCIGTSESSEPQLGTFVKKTGDNMSGRLGTLFGFQTGEDGKIFFQTKQEKEGAIIKDQYISIEEKLKIDSHNLFIDNKILFNHFSRDSDKKEILEIDGGNIVDFKESSIQITGTLNANSLSVSNDSFTYSSNTVYHAGNSNKEDIDWTMKNSNVKGSLLVEGNSTLKGLLTSLQKVELGSNNNVILYINDDENMEVNGDIELGKTYKIKIDKKDVLGCPSENNIQLSSIGGSLILGSGDDSTTNIRLWNTLTTYAGDHNLIDKFGNASFMNTFEAGYGFGNKLLSTAESSVVIHEKLRFGDDTGPFISADTYGIGLEAKYMRGEYNATHRTTINIGQSTSIYQDQSRNSESVFIGSTADFFTFNNPIEAKDFIGITESTTRLSDNTLFFTDNTHLVNVVDVDGTTGIGIRHYGDSYFMDNLSSERFSTGFAGEGWAIRKKLDTGNVELTVDEAVIRKKMRVYELEIQKISVVNGSLWVSDSCSADKVTTIP